jgi:predicted nucleic-acid-binding protein
MMAIDTNLLLRLILNDDARQTAASLRTLQSGIPVVLLNTVLQETAWVLESVYARQCDDIADVLGDIATIPTVILEAPEIAQAIEWYRRGMDIADAIHLAGAVARQCDRMLTFDKDFVKRAKGKTACEVTIPA